MVGHGLTYIKLITVMIKKYTTLEMTSPIKPTQRTVFVDQNSSIQTGYNLPDILLNLHHAFINPPANKNILLKKYTAVDLIAELPCNVVRAAAILSGELQPLPNLTALMAYLSCANLIYRRWSVYLYDHTKRTNNELKHTCYTESKVKGQNVISVVYNLCTVVKKYCQSVGDIFLIKALRDRCYGSLLPNM